MDEEVLTTSEIATEKRTTAVSKEPRLKKSSQLPEELKQRSRSQRSLSRTGSRPSLNGSKSKSTSNVNRRSKSRRRDLTNDELLPTLRSGSKKHLRRGGGSKAKIYSGGGSRPDEPNESLTLEDLGMKANSRSRKGGSRASLESSRKSAGSTKHKRSSSRRRRSSSTINMTMADDSLGTSNSSKRSSADSSNNSHPPAGLDSSRKSLGADKEGTLARLERRRSLTDIPVEPSSESANKKDVGEKKKRRHSKPSPDEILPISQWGSQRKVKTNDRKKMDRARSVGRDKTPNRRDGQSVSKAKQLRDGTIAPSRRQESQKVFDAPALGKDESHAMRKQEITPAATRPQLSSKSQSRSKSQPKPRSGTPSKKRRGFLQGLKQWSSRRGFSEQNGTTLSEKGPDADATDVVATSTAKEQEIEVLRRQPMLVSSASHLSRFAMDDASQTDQSHTTVKRDNVRRSSLTPPRSILGTEPRRVLYSKKGDDELDEADPTHKRHNLYRKDDLDEVSLSTGADDASAPEKIRVSSLSSDERHAKKSKKKRKHRKDGKRRSKEGERSTSLESPRPHHDEQLLSIQSLKDFLDQKRDYDEPTMLSRRSTSRSMPGTTMEIALTKKRQSRSLNRAWGSASKLAYKDDENFKQSTNEADTADRRAKLAALEARSMNSRFSSEANGGQNNCTNGDQANASMNSIRLTMSVSTMEAIGSSFEQGNSAHNVPTNSLLLENGNSDHTPKGKKKKVKKKKKKREPAAASGNLSSVPPFAAAGYDSDDDFSYPTPYNSPIVSNN